MKVLRERGPEMKDLERAPKEGVACGLGRAVRRPGRGAEEGARGGALEYLY